MRSISAALLASFTSPLFAHPGHGLVIPHLHAADTYLLLGIGIAAVAAILVRKLK